MNACTIVIADFTSFLVKGADITAAVEAERARESGLSSRIWNRILDVADEKLFASFDGVDSQHSKALIIRIPVVVDIGCATVVNQAAVTEDSAFGRLISVTKWKSVGAKDSCSFIQDGAGVSVVKIVENLLLFG